MTSKIILINRRASKALGISESPINQAKEQLLLQRSISNGFRHGQTNTEHYPTRQLIAARGL